MHGAALRAALMLKGRWGRVLQRRPEAVSRLQPFRMQKSAEKLEMTSVLLTDQQVEKCSLPAGGAHELNRSD